MQSENYKMLRSRMKALMDKKKGNSQGGQRNPMLAGRRSSLLANNGVDMDKNSISMQDNESLAMQLDIEADHKVGMLFFCFLLVCISILIPSVFFHFYSYVILSFIYTFRPTWKTSALCRS